MDSTFLSKMGLSPGEIKVYSALLSFGGGSVNKVHEKTGIERRNIYDILNKLIERGLVTYLVENKKRFFQVSNPHKLVDYLNDQKNHLDQIKVEVEKELPQLVKQFELRSPSIYAEVYRGAEGIKAVWEDMLSSKGVYWIGSGRYIPKRFPAWFSQWNRRRIKAGVPWFDLLRNEMKKEIKKPYELEQVKFLPLEFSGNPISIGIFNNKVVHFLIGKELFAFVIQSNELAENYRAYHQYLWNNVATK